MTDRWFKNIHKSSVLRLWSYRTTFFIVLIIFLSFCAVIPIDSILQASQAPQNYALNTFVVIGALVLFGIVSAFLISTRIYTERSSIQDIPRAYIPLEPGDLPQKSLDYIENNYKECLLIKNTINAKAVLNVKHPGLSSPDSKFLPPLLAFEDVIKVLTLKFKWDENFFPGTKIPGNLSFREIVAFLETKFIITNSNLNREYVDLYEELRYSGKTITEEEFLRFMELSVEFMKSPRIGIDYGNSSTSLNRVETSKCNESQFSQTTDGVSTLSKRR